MQLKPVLPSGAPFMMHPGFPAPLSPNPSDKMANIPIAMKGAYFANGPFPMMPGLPFAAHPLAMPIMPRASMSAPTTPHLPMSRSMDSLPLAMNNRYAKHGGKFNMDTVVQETELVDEKTNRTIGSQMTFYLEPAVAKKHRKRRTFKELQRKFACAVDDCDKVYSTRSAMATHMRIKHQMEPAEIIEPDSPSVDSDAEEPATPSATSSVKSGNASPGPGTPSARRKSVQNPVERVKNDTPYTRPRSASLDSASGSSSSSSQQPIAPNLGPLLSPLARRPGPQQYMAYSCDDLLSLGPAGGMFGMPVAMTPPAFGGRGLNYSVDSLLDFSKLHVEDASGDLTVAALDQVLAGLKSGDGESGAGGEARAAAAAAGSGLSAVKLDSLHFTSISVGRSDDPDEELSQIFNDFLKDEPRDAEAKPCAPHTPDDMEVTLDKLQEFMEGAEL